MEQGGCGWGGDWRDRGGFTLRFRSPECVYMLRSQGRGGVRTLGPQAQAGGGTGRAQVGGQGARMPSRHSRLDSGRDRQGWGAHARATAFSSPAGGARHNQASVFPQASQSIWLPPASYPPSPIPASGRPLLSLGLVRLLASSRAQISQCSPAAGVQGDLWHCSPHCYWTSGVELPQDSVR